MPPVRNSTLQASSHTKSAPVLHTNTSRLRAEFGFKNKVLRLGSHSQDTPLCRCKYSKLWETLRTKPLRSQEFEIKNTQPEAKNSLESNLHQYKDLQMSNKATPWFSQNCPLGSSLLLLSSWFLAVLSSSMHSRLLLTPPTGVLEFSQTVLTT